MASARRTAGHQSSFLKYGAQWHADTDPLEIEFECIRRFGSWEFRGRKCGNGLPFHVKQSMRLLWPDMDFHRWTELIVDEFLKSPGRTAVFGPSSSSKSFTFSRAALVMFYARPKGTTVLISSTTLDALKRRIWGYVTDSDKQARARYPHLAGSMIESKLMLLADEATEEGRSFKDGIVGVACRVSGQFRGMDAYIGSKNEVMILVCDECQFMQMGFLDGLANLESNERCYAALMGNLPDIHNPLGKAAEPKCGWDALPDTEKTRVFDTRWQNGRAIQLIGMDSPNLDFPEGQEPYRNLIGRRYIEQCAENYGRESDKFNMFASGKIPRSSMDRTVFTKAQCVKFNASERVVWGHEKLVRGYGLDAAYSGIGGDRTVGAPWIFGKDASGQWRFWIGDLKIYPGSSSSKMSHSEAIALEMRSECEAHGVPPEHCFYDGTGRSELTSALAKLWSPMVVPVEFGGAASERPGFTGERHFGNDQQGDFKTCRELFDRFVTELWFAHRECILSNQMRGLSEVAIEEGSQRKWELVRGAKYCIETKEDMRERGLRSPDLSDCIVVSLEGARRLGFPLGKLAQTRKSTQNGWFAALQEESWRKSKQQLLIAA